MKRYKITCLKCKQEAYVGMAEDRTLMFEGGMQTNLLAGRYRKDNKWGWECVCGNDNRLAKSEESFMDQLVRGTAQHIEDIKASLKIDDKKQFVMEAI